uniref:Ankyrin repeat domain-containing protein 52 n=1 Tax=Colletotrichum fructicola (strain Nara gc5) TaxID=1213859 RepID=L2FGK8_COLFN
MAVNQVLRWSGPLHSEDIWAAAIKTLGDDLKSTIDPAQLSKRAVVEDVLAATAKAKKSCDEKSSYISTPKGKKIPVRHILNKVDKWASNFKQLGDACVQFDPIHAALPWAGVCFILKIAAGDLHAYARVLEGIAYIAECICHNALIETGLTSVPTASAEELRRALVKLYASILTYLVKAGQYYRMSTSTDTRRDLQAWLGCPPSNDVYDESIQKRLRGTCEWILARAEFCEWLSPSDSSKLMWINGRAGYGKTILCAKLVEVVLSQTETPAAHFFLSSNSAGRSDPFLAMRSWLTAIAFQNHTAFDVIQKRRSKDYETVATRTKITHLFREIVQAVPSCTFILDGLDECTSPDPDHSGRHPVTHFLDELRQAIEGTTARVLVVSRNEPEIRQGLTQYPGFSEYAISAGDVSADNRTCSEHIVYNKLSKQDEQTKSIISKKMVHRCDGQFQWMNMVGDLLRSSKSLKQLEMDIDETPAGLDSMYDHNWKRIEGLPHRDRTRAFSLLRWAMFALRPLTVCEITEAVLLTDDCDDFPVDQMPDSVDNDYVQGEILGLCGPLIEVSGMSSEPPGSRKIHLHFSVKQYLLGKILPGGQVLLANESLRAENEAVEGVSLARLCLRYISFKQVWDDSLHKHKYQIGRFRDYAAKYWYLHTNVSTTNDEAFVEAMNALFDGRAGTWDSWREWFDVNSEDLEPEAKGPVLPASPIYYASYLGLTGVVRHLLKDGKHDPNKATGSGRVGLEIACKKGHREIVRMLLEWGASIDVAGSRGRTPLNAASENGHLDVVKLLLDKGADITVPNSDGWTPLNTASDNGHLDVVKLLLAKGADITVPNSDGWTPLNAASDSGHLEVVKLLFAKGANITVPNGDGWTPLNAASDNGHLEVVKLLLAKGANITVANNKGWTPLYAASCKGHLDVVKLLLDMGADITVPNGDGWTPLNAASDNGHLEVVKLLLAKGANITVANNKGWTPLYAASCKGHLDVVKLLLDMGADITVPNGDGWTPLNAASDNGHLDVVRLLLDKGANITVVNNKGWTPLYAASCKGHLDIVKLLLDKGADITVPNSDGWTPLNTASDNGHLDVVKLLLDKGADITVANNNGWKPLNSALENGHLETDDSLSIPRQGLKARWRAFKGKLRSASGWWRKLFGQ